MIMRLDSEPSEVQLKKLSENELDVISGGLVNVSFTVLIGEESSEFTTQGFSNGSHSGLAISGQKRRSLLGLQFSGSFASMSHASSFFSGLIGFLGRG